MNELYKLTASEGIQLIKSGKLSVTEWTQSCINRIEQKEKDVEAWCFFSPEIIKKNALRIDNEIFKNEYKGKLYGALVGVKDIFNTTDMPTSMGSPIWKDFTPGNDARVLYSIREQNGIIAGKTVTAEFAVHYPDQTKNPWNKKYSPGTSSSGSAAAVADGMVPLSLGTQTAGSITRPASYCGCYGFKPSYGTVPRTGILKTTDTLDSVGLFARSIDDCRLLFNIIRISGPNYPIIHKYLNDDARQQKKSDKWKVGIITDQFWTYKSASDYSRKEFDKFIQKLGANKDVTIEPVKINDEWNMAHENHRIIYHKCLSYYFKEEFKSQSQISPIMAKLIEEGNQISPAQYQEAIKRQAIFTNSMDESFSNFDIVLTLSTAGEAPPYGTAIDLPDTSLLWTLTGTPSLSIPLFRSPANLPYGLLAISRKYSDYKLFNFFNYLSIIGLIDNNTNTVFPQ